MNITVFETDTEVYSRSIPCLKAPFCSVVLDSVVLPVCLQTPVDVSPAQRSKVHKTQLNLSQKK